MKKIGYKIICILVCLISLLPYRTLADGTGGGTGSGGGSQGGAPGGSASSKLYWLVLSDDKMNLGAYRFDLVYKPKNGDRYILKTIVTYSPSAYHGSSGCVYISDYEGKVKRYNDAVNKVGGAKYGSAYRTSGPLVDLSRRLANGETVDKIFNNNKMVDEQVIRNYITSSEGFAMYDKLGEMQLPQDDNPGNINSYGYRILIQKIQLFSGGGSSRGCDQFTNGIAMTRKDAASNNRVKQYFTSKPVEIGTEIVKGLVPSDLWTTRDDIGIENGYPQNIIGVSGHTIKYQKRPYFANYNYGLGYNILWFYNPFRNYDYTIDSACTNCNSTDKENKSYIIQDATNWDAIFNSPTSTVDNAKTYYKKYDNVFCREEYNVSFPNLSNTIKVQTGRYFTVNPTDTEVTSSPMPNFKPVKVTKTRYCKDKNKNSSNLSKFKQLSEKSFSNDTGKVYFRYIENMENSKYSMKDKEEMRRYDKPDNFESYISGDTLKMSVTYSYTLPLNYYRYVKKSDGLSSKTTPSDLSKYQDLGVSNLPISFENKNKTKAADIKFSYELPKTDSYSKMYKAYVKGNSYLLDKKVENVYKKYIDNKLSDTDAKDIKESACAKMYGYGSSEFNSCAALRKSNKIGNCYENNNQIDSDNTSVGYSCVISFDDNDDCNYSNYSLKGRSWNIEENKCCPVGYKYNPNTKTCEDLPKCQYIGNKYYGKDGTEVSKEQFKIDCPAVTTPECPTDCEYGCCPSGECAPMPTDSSGMIVCPGTGGRKVIYRTIDLQQPFPGQGAEKRKTGSNWCSYDVKTQKLDCNWDNNVSKAYILKKGKKVHNSDHVLYKVTLNSETISKIRKYNDSHKYDDWDLSCTNGRKCTSSFLKNEVKVTGKCANVTKSNFESCAKIKVS